jgi:transposase
MLHGGVDMHKNFSLVTVVDDSGNEVVKGKKLENRDLEIAEFFKSLQDKLRVVIEAGSNWMWMTDLLDDYGIEDELCYTFKGEN